MKALAIAMLLPVAAFAGMALNPDVTQENLHQTVCVPNWSKTVRPPASYTNRIKRQLMDAAGIPWSKARDLELDHVVSLEVGGAPRDPGNLRLQWWYGDPVATPQGVSGVDTQAHAKDVVENAVKRAICAGKMNLQEGQSCLWNDWRACAKQHPEGTP